MKKTTVLAMVATLAIGMSGAAWAQETTGSNGEQVDGYGSAGNVQNQFTPDGPNEGSSWLLQGLHQRSARTNNVQGINNCDVKILDENCFKSAAKPSEMSPSQ